MTDKNSSEQPMARGNWVGVDNTLAERIKAKHGDDKFGKMLDHVRTIVENEVSMRQRWLSNASNQTRNVRRECKYLEEPTAEEYYALYERHPIAARVVELFPRESWQVQPYLYETENEEEETPFEQAWHILCKGMRGLKSWHKGDDEFNPIWETLQKADELSGIGHYGIIVLGFDDVGPGRLQLSDPCLNVSDALAYPNSAAQGKYGANPNGSFGASPHSPVQKRLLWMRPFHEVQAQIASYDSNHSSPRFGAPEMYNIIFNDPREGNQAGVGLTQGNYRVHWTRVIHIADNLMSGDVFGIPRMKQVLDRLTDLEKEYGATAEALWLQAFGIISFETHPQLGGDVEVDDTDLKDMMEMVRNGLQRWVRLAGMQAKMLSPALADPRPQIAAAIEAVCIKLSCPVRIFKGSERGELASTQDDDAWNDRIGARRSFHITPRIIMPLVDRLIMAGALPAPVEGYGIGWPDLTSRSKAEKASTALTRTQAMSAYLAGGVDTMIGRMDYLTKELDYSQKEAMEIMENVGLGPDGEALGAGADTAELNPQDQQPTEPIKDEEVDPTTGLPKPLPDAQRAS